jgi:hypothetical protein
LPARGVVFLLLAVEAREEAVELGRPLELVAHQGEGVGVRLDVDLVVEAVLDGVVDEPAEEDDVGAAADRRVDVGARRGAAEARIGRPRAWPCAPSRALLIPANIDAGWFLRRVPADDEDHVGSFEIDQ